MLNLKDKKKSQPMKSNNGTLTLLLGIVVLLVSLLIIYIVAEKADILFSSVSYAYY